MSQIRIAAIYDDPKTVDRYTVITDYVLPVDGSPMHDQFMYLGCDGNGGHSFSQWGHLERKTYAELLKKKTQGFRAITHLGKLVPFESLNGDTQRHIAQRVLMED